MKKIILLWFFAQSFFFLHAANVTFRVDMNNVSFSGAVFITGDKIDQWYGTYVVMEDPDGDGIYEAELKLSPGVVEYKYMWDNWANVEDLQVSSDGNLCTITHNGNTQRFAVIENEDMVLPLVCFGKCLECATSNPPANVDVTFGVDMTTSPATNVYLTGNIFDNWCGTCISMSDPDSDQIYEKVMNLSPGAYEFKFTKDGSFEQFPTGQACTITNFGYHNRILYIPMNGPSTMTLNTPVFNQCAPTQTNITLRVDMSGEMVASSGVHIVGSFNAWDHGANPMIDIGNGLWETTLVLTEGNTIEYKFVNGNSVTGEENVDAQCSNSFGNREVVVGSYERVLMTDCFGKCESCDDNLTLTWSDEFDESELDLSKWTPEIGNGSWGWGNNELQFYTANPGNIDLIGGELLITAKEESFSGFDYTSARIKTDGKAGCTYGRVEARIKLPKGKGLWPAFWMMPADNVYGGWPSSGEIDIMEFIGDRLTDVHGTLHYGPDPGNGHKYTGGTYTASPLVDFSQDYHIYAIEWEEEQVRWYVDGIQFFELHRRDLCPWNWPFDQEFYIILNVAVGGNWPGSPNNSTSFPQIMAVDYVRIYEDIPASVNTPVLAENNFRVYPNPSSSQIQLSFTEEFARRIEVKVIDSQGKVLLQQEVDPSNAVLDLSDLARGMYFLQASGNNEVFVRKFIKQ